MILSDSEILRIIMDEAMLTLKMQLKYALLPELLGEYYTKQLVQMNTCNCRTNSDESSTDCTDSTRIFPMNVSINV